MGTPNRVEGIITIENARVMFKNFEGRETQYNRAGSKNFCVVLDDDFAAQLIADGWTSVRNLPAKAEGEPDRKIMQVTVSYKIKPAQITMITSKRRTALTEDTVELLDDLEFKLVDLTISPYNWNMPARGNIPATNGVSAYLREMYVTIEESYLSLKYAEEEEPSED